MNVKNNRGQQKKFVSIEDLVPKDHILKDIDRTIDFTFICEEVRGCIRK